MASRREKVNVPYTICLRSGGSGANPDRDRPHVDLANLNDQVESVRHFARRWCDYKVETERQVRFILNIRDNLRDAWRGSNKAYDNLFDNYSAQFQLTRLGLGFVVDNIWAAIPILFLKDQQAGKTAVCANLKCPNPYFIRRRKTQKYCEAGPCVEEAQRTQKREWWKRSRGKGVQQ